MIVEQSDLKSEAHRLIDRLPESATWDDLMYEIYVRQSIDRGLADSEAGRVTDVAEVRTQFGLSSSALLRRPVGVAAVSNI
jgi:hypothetical protein